MSDSDDDFLENNIIQNGNTFLRGQSFQNNFKINKIPSSTFNSTLISQNYLRSNGYNQRSMNCRRQTSPMSMRSVPDFAPHNIHNSYYTREMSCQRSLVNGRSQSPGSVKSVESSASVSAYIAQAFKSTHFNKYDLRVIKEAYNKYLKKSMRRRIEKRRNLRLFMKHHRRKSGDDSGDQGSDSSISSNDDKLSRYTMQKDILKPSNCSNRTEILDFQASVLGSDMYKDCTENLKQNALKNLYKCSNTINNTIQEKDNNLVITQKDRFTKGFQLPNQRFNISTNNPVSKSSQRVFPTNDDAHSLPLPNAKIDNSASENEEIFFEKTIEENSLSRKRSMESKDLVFSDTKRNKVTDNVSSLSCTTTSNVVLDDNMFKKPQMPLTKLFNPKPNFLSEQSILKSSDSLIKNIRQDKSEFINDINKLKRNRSERQINGFINIRNIVYKKSEGNNKKEPTNINYKDEQLPDNMTSKTQEEESIDKRKSTNKDISSTKSKVNNKSSAQKKSCSKNIRNKQNKLQEPQIPMNNNNNEIQSDLVNDLNSEKLISKSLQPLVGNVEITSTIYKSSKSQKGQNGTEKNSCEKDPNDNNCVMALSNTDISMKPSFIKRKLFTQKLDIVDEKNTSVDSTSTNSPQTRSYNFREKNKVRKLATSQSCLSRDIQGEENILDLIRKIVPDDQINMTSLSNKKDLRKSNADEEKENLTATSDCNKGNESDTFTDDEIFKVGMVKQNKKQITQTSVKEQNSQCKVKKLQTETIQSSSNLTEPKCTTTRTISSCVRSFWDTDFESDIDDIARAPLKPLANKSLDVIKQRAPEAFQDYEKRKSNKPTPKCNGRKPVNGSIIKNKTQSQEALAIKYQVPEKRNDNTPKENCNIKEDQPINKSQSTKNILMVNDNKEDKNKTEPKDRKTVQRKSKLQTSREIKLLLNDTLNSSMSDYSILTRSRRKNESYNTSLRKNVSKSTEHNSSVNFKLSLKKNIKADLVKKTRKDKTITAKNYEHDKKKTALKAQRRQPQNPIETKSYLNDTLNSSTSDRSILTRSLSSKFKKQLST